MHAPGLHRRLRRIWGCLLWTPTVLTHVLAPSVLGPDAASSGLSPDSAAACWPLPPKTRWRSARSHAVLAGAARRASASRNRRGRSAWAAPARAGAACRRRTRFRHRHRHCHPLLAMSCGCTNNTCVCRDSNCGSAGGACGDDVSCYRAPSTQTAAQGAARALFAQRTNTESG